MLDEKEALAAAEHARGVQDTERQQLDVLRLYVTGKQALPLVVPKDAPAEVRELARIARINLIKIVVEAMVESLFVDNFRSPDTGPTDMPDDPEGVLDDDAADPVSEIWRVWQKNRMDGGQSGLYRAIFTYGYGYAAFTPGRPLPVIRCFSPRTMTALYGDDPEWPAMALERRRGGRYRLYDSTHVYTFDFNADEKKLALVAGQPEEHGSPYCPVVKYTDVVDLDVDDEPESLSPVGRRQNETRMVAGQVAPLMTLQDQADVSSFALKAAEWYAGFRQRWVIGWTPSSSGEKVKSAASQLWTFDENPDDVRVGEFSQTDLRGFLESRESVAKFAATLSQTPVHELIGELVNLSAEALAAAEAGRDRKVGLARTGIGESHEQLAQGIGALMGLDIPEDIEVVWRDTSARAFGAIVDGLGKLAQMLQIPPQMLWDRIPGVTRQDVRRWKVEAAKGDVMASLTGMLDAQADPAPAPGTGETRTPSGIILPPGVSA
jgi:hypothetical protein